MLLFTADEHYYHKKIITPEYCNRPFRSIQENNEVLIENNNKVVKKPSDRVIHIGDFCSWKIQKVLELVKYLNGKHSFVPGSHDHWIKKNNGRLDVLSQIYTLNYKKQYIVLCHYNMGVWPRSHYNSWQLHGHSHGGLDPVGKQHDVGVDNNNFFPISFDELVEIMKDRPDNFNYLGRHSKELGVGRYGRKTSVTMF